MSVINRELHEVEAVFLCGCTSFRECKIIKNTLTIVRGNLKV